ncbi:MAG: MCP four helix bundle domain-containing protein [Flavobacteriales bacterium]|nr:MCP four helix bundle domain-containing protein [Flavobacteriales bacterium]
MTTLSKIKWIAGVLLVFAIVLTTNLIDKNNFNKLRNSVVTIYEDRVVASDLIFEITVLIQEKEIALATSDSIFFQVKNDKINQDIKGFITTYEKTKLTTSEQKLFTTLKTELQRLEKQEKTFIDSNYKDNSLLFTTINEIVHNLYRLSKVQLEEGKRQMQESNKTIKSINIFTTVEILFLIAMAILIQIILLYKKKT